MDRRDSAKYLGTLSALGANLKVEKEALQERNIELSDLADDVEAIGREQALALVQKADLTIDF